jgi:perosamine synthetase
MSTNSEEEQEAQLARPIPVTVPSIEDSDISNVVTVLNSGMLVHGSFAQQVERVLSEMLGAKYVSVVSSGTATLHLALLSEDIGPGDEVIVPAFSYVATANVVELVGATPVFVDIELGSFNIDVSRIEAVISSRTRAIMPVHEFGFPAQMDEITGIAKAHHLKVIEDAACALGSTYGARAVGTIGDFGSFSFHPRKSVTSGEGGALISRSQDDYRYVNSMRSHGLSIGEDGVGYTRAGFNYRMTDIQAALLVGQLSRLLSLLDKRIQIAETYKREIEASEMVLPSSPSYGKHSWQSFHMVAPSTDVRAAFVHHLQKHGVQSTYGAQCIPTEPYYQKKYGHSPNDYPVAYQAATCGVVLPLFPSMQSADIERVIAAVNSFQFR